MGQGCGYRIYSFAPGLEELEEGSGLSGWNLGVKALGHFDFSQKYHQFREKRKKPAGAGRVPPGTVVEVTGVVNAKVVRVAVELPNGKTGKGMARVADWEE